MLEKDTQENQQITAIVKTFIVSLITFLYRHACFALRWRETKQKINSLENVLLLYYVQEKFYEREEKIKRGVNSWK